MHIASLSTINTAECTKRIASARKVWEGCHDGPSLTHSQGLDRERDKLPSQGYNATYWVKDASPGRSMEYWSSGNGNNCMGLVFETSGGTFVKTANSEPKQCVNPAPIK